MKRVGLLALAAVALGACAETTAPPAVDAGLAPFHAVVGARAAAGSYIVVLQDGVNPRAVAAVAGVRPQYVYESSIRGFATELTDGQLRALRRLDGVAYIETDQVVALAPPCGTPNGGPCPPPDDGDGGGSQVVPWGIARVNGPVTGVSPSGVAWVIDTGIDLDHPDLSVDAARSVSFVTKGKVTPDDGNGHGTHVAGTIAAKNNGIDVVGVAPGATVVAVRVLDNSGSGTWSAIIAGIDHVSANGRNGDVANMSLGGGASQAVDDAVKAAAAKGVRFALAAGNDGANAANYSPARVNGSNIFTISATASNDCLTSWSNWGNPPVDYAEPGSGILSTRRGGGTTTMSGTSMAAPHAAGLLLVGGIRSGGTACNDRDGTADVIGVH